MPHLVPLSAMFRFARDRSPGRGGKRPCRRFAHARTIQSRSRHLPGPSPDRARRASRLPLLLLRPSGRCRRCGRDACGGRAPASAPRHAGYTPCSAVSVGRRGARPCGQLAVRTSGGHADIAALVHQLPYGAGCAAPPTGTFQILRNLVDHHPPRKAHLFLFHVAPVHRCHGGST